jgi:hypothetical protein
MMYFKTIIVLSTLIATTDAFCIPGVNHCVNEQHVGVCFYDKHFEGAYLPGKIWINPLTTVCINQRVTTGGDVDRYENQPVGVLDSKIVFPLITVRYAICPELQTDGQGCLNNVTTIMKEIGRQFEDVLIEEELPNFLNSFMSTWTTEEAWSTRFSEIEERIHVQLQKNIDDGGMPLTITRVAIPEKPRLDETQSKRFAARAEQAKIMEETKRDSATSIAEHEILQAKADSDTKIAKHKQHNAHLLIIEQLEHEKNVSINNRQIAIIDAETTKVNSIAEADSNSRILTPEYLKLKEIEALASVKKIVYTGGSHTVLSDIGHTGENRVPIRVV